MRDLAQALSSSPRFLITRLSAIGDCIHTIPLVHALKEKYPYCHIAWATQGGPASLLEGTPGLDQIVSVPKGWLKSWKSIRQLRSELRQLAPDVCIDPQSLTKSSMLAWLSGASFRIGFAKPQGRELSLWTNNIRVTPMRDHVVDRYLELLGPLGITHPDVKFRMSACATSEQNMTSTLSQLPNEFAVINPGAGWPSKVWPAERYAQVAQHLGERDGVESLVVWAGPDERKMAETIVEQSSGFAKLAPDTSLTELRVLVEKARLFIGSDTGPMHLAVAMGTPCVALFGPTSPQRCGPYGVGHQTLHTPDVRNQKIRSDDNRAMLLTTVDQVVEAVTKLLERPKRICAA